MKKSIDVAVLFTPIRIHTQKCVLYVALKKKSMFHENYVNDIKCFCYVTKEEVSVPSVC